MQLLKLGGSPAADDTIGYHQFFWRAFSDNQLCALLIQYF